jgi:hypothetical protein
MVNRPDGNQFHFDAATYLQTIRAEVPAYKELQDAVAEAPAGMHSERCSSWEWARGDAADLRVSRLQDPLPEGNFDLVVSALAVHHLDGAGKVDPFCPRRRPAPAGRTVVPGGATTALRTRSKRLMAVDARSTRAWLWVTDRVWCSRSCDAMMPTCVPAGGGVRRRVVLLLVRCRFSLGRVRVAHFRTPTKMVCPRKSRAATSHC